MRLRGGGLIGATVTPNISAAPGVWSLADVLTARKAGTWPFNPGSLFEGGARGAWYDPSDLSTLWKDTAGTVPVTADGDLVARMDDKSGNGNHLLQATSTLRPAYRTSGGLRWLEGDGVDDTMSAAAQLETEWFGVAGARVGAFKTGALVLWGMQYQSSASRYGMLVASSAGIGGVPIPGNRISLATLIPITGIDRVVSVIGNATEVAEYRDGVEIDAQRPPSTTPGSSGSAQFYKICDTASGRFYGGIIVHRTLPAASRQQVERWIATKTGVTL